MEYIGTDHLLAQVAALSRAAEAFELIRTFKLHRHRRVDDTAHIVIVEVWYSRSMDTSLTPGTRPATSLI
jgi:quinol monooxygenase YgiN